MGQLAKLILVKIISDSVCLCASPFEAVNYCFVFLFIMSVTDRVNRLSNPIGRVRLTTRPFPFWLLSHLTFDLDFSYAYGS